VVYGKRSAVRDPGRRGPHVAPRRRRRRGLRDALRPSQPGGLLPLLQDD
ncbi:MAG: RNA polymerase ECF-type sigma factor, partial [uncultured Rubrobacteraceae bacterium]